MKCKICGKEFELKKDSHYIAREEEVTGIATIARNEEVSLWDSFDCPYCGCQNTVQKRLRIARSRLYVTELKSEDTEDCDHNCEDCWNEYTCESSSYKEGLLEKTLDNTEEMSDNKGIDKLPECLGRYSEKECNKECSVLDMCVSRSDNNEICND